MPNNQSFYRGKSKELNEAIHNLKSGWPWLGKCNGFDIDFQ